MTDTGSGPTSAPRAVTVVVPTRNRRPMLQRLLTSVLGQQDVDVAVVVVDEASSDDTPAFLDALGDPRVRVVRNDPPLRLPGARNAGLAEVRTPWVAFVDDDDLWAPDKLAEQFRALATTPGARWACAGVVQVDEHLRVVGGQVPPAPGDALDALLAFNAIPGGGSGVLVEAALLRDVGGFDRSLRSSEDWEAWIRLAERSPVAVANRPLVAYTIWSSSMSHDSVRMEADTRAIHERYRALRTQRRVGNDEVAMQQYWAGQDLRVGRTARFVRRNLDLAFRHGKVQKLAAAGLAVVAPATLERRYLGEALRNLPPGWIADAEAWLDPIREHDT